jgi:hypothetical protein
MLSLARLCVCMQTEVARQRELAASARAASEKLVRDTQLISVHQSTPFYHCYCLLPHARQLYSAWLLVQLVLG